MHSSMGVTESRCARYRVTTGGRGPRGAVYTPTAPSWLRVPKLLAIPPIVLRPPRRFIVPGQIVGNVAGVPYLRVKSEAKSRKSGATGSCETVRPTRPTAETMYVV